MSALHKGREFRCAWCKGVFVSKASEEEAVAELEQNFKGFAPEDCDVVCDVCYRKAMLLKPIFEGRTND